MARVDNSLRRCCVSLNLVSEPHSLAGANVVAEAVSCEHKFANGIVVRYAQENDDGTISVRSFGRGVSNVQFLADEGTDFTNRNTGKSLRRSDEFWDDNAAEIEETVMKNQGSMK